MKGLSLISSMRTAGPASSLLKRCGSDEARMTQMQELSHREGVMDPDLSVFLHVQTALMQVFSLKAD